MEKDSRAELHTGSKHMQSMRRNFLSKSATALTAQALVAGEAGIDGHSHSRLAH
jgi:hypothetical protein